MRLGWSLTFALLLALAGWALILPAVQQVGRLMRAGFGL